MGLGKPLFERSSKKLNAKISELWRLRRKRRKVSAKSIENVSNDDGDDKENVISKYKFALL